MTSVARAFLSLAFLTMVACNAGDSRPSRYDVTHYDIEVRFDLARKALSGHVTMKGTALEPMTVITYNASEFTLSIDSVMYDGRKLRTAQFHDSIDAFLPDSLKPGGTFEIVTYYRGVAAFDGRYDSGGVYIPDSANFTHLVTSSEPSFARNWWPCKDTPGDKAPVSMHITIPEPLVAASNGILKDIERNNGLATYHWETRYPMATYLVSVAIAPYVQMHDVYTGLAGEQLPITYFVFPADTAKARVEFQNTGSMLHFLAEKFCEYPFIDEKFGYAEVNGSTTMENQTLCSIQASLITGKHDGEITIFHETAHQWWGDLITPATWNHTWLNEGFATYTEALYLEHTKGIEAYHSSIKRLASARIGAFAGSVIGKSETAFWDSFGSQVYFKGALVLHMLRGVLGDSVFFSAMRNYVNDPALRYGNARTEDFVRICEKTSGQGLHWFFDEWVYASVDSIDRPVYEYSWMSEPRSQNTSAVSIKITQPYGEKMLYRMPMNISVWSGGKENLFSTIDSLANQIVTLSVPGKVDSVDLDRGGWIFKSLRKKEGF